MDLYSEDIELLKELYSSSEKDLYFFHEKYKLSPAQLARTLKKFESEELIEIKNRIVVLTEKGRKWIFHNRGMLFLKEKSKYWKKIPDEMKQEPLGINELYKPNRSTLDKEIFKNIEDGK
jgi:DNA-binding PadR family transcriptional regulator